MSKTLLVSGTKTFRITIPDEAKVTFGPWSPGEKQNGYGDKLGTLRVYESAKSGANILGVWSGVTSFRIDSIVYEEQVAREEGAIIWNSSKDGYKREEKVKRETDWISNPEVAPKILEAGEEGIEG